MCGMDGGGWKVGGKGRLQEGYYPYRQTLSGTSLVAVAKAKNSTGNQTGDDEESVHRIQTELSY